jgi:predicted CoA-binding protein
MNTEETIRKILKTARTIAVVGISSQNHRPGFTVPAYMQTQGYRIIPVNPYLEERLGEKAYPDLKSILEPFDLILLFRRSKEVPRFVDQAIDIGVPAVWMQLGVIHKPAAKKAAEAGLDVVVDRCIAVEHRHLKSMGKI